MQYIFLLVIVLAVSGLMISCMGPETLYNVDLRYIPTESASSEINKIEHIKPVTIAVFQDIREIEDHIVIGKVISDRGESIPVLPKYTKPPEAVVRAMEDFLIRKGYTVAAEHPGWDLQESLISKSWGTILLGGTINELFVTCDRSGPVKKYTSRVNLTVILADISEKRILYKVSVESAPTRDHIRFSEITMEKEINRALSDAVERVFTGSELLSKIESISR